MRKQNAFKRSKLNIDTVKRIIDAAVERQFDILSFTGGEPLLHLDELTELINYAGAAGINYIRTGTNGFMFRDSQKPDFEKRIRTVVEKLADTPLRNFWISIDSAVPEEHERIRGFEGVISGIEKALPVFHEAGIYPAANLGINRYLGGTFTSEVMRKSSYSGEYAYLFYNIYRKAFADFYDFVIKLGFTTVNMCYPMSMEKREPGDNNLDCVYAAASTETMVNFDREEKSMLFKALMDVIPEYRNKIRIFSPRISLYKLYQHYAGHDAGAYPCRGGIDFFFVDAQKGHTYPCGYRGDEDFGYLWEMKALPSHAEQECFRCDWECFRDPSEMAGVISTALRSPGKVLGKLLNDREYFKILREDLAYYRQCNWFNGRS